MVQYGYSLKIGEDQAHAVVRDVAISYKVAVLIGKRIKGMPAQKALRFLDNVVAKKEAVPYTKFSDSVGHKPGIGPGRYPEKAAKIYSGLIKNAVANAEDKGLGKEVTVQYVVPQQASRPWHSGRLGRRKFKRSHIEVVVTSAEQPKKAEHSKKPHSKSAKKAKGDSQ